MVTHDDTGVVTFRFVCPRAREVFLAGDFNGWASDTHPMKRTKNGIWVCRLVLPEGVYQFKYLADGEWYLDYAAFGLELNTFGWNSVVLVQTRSQRQRSRADESHVSEELQWEPWSEIAESSRLAGTTVR